MKTLVAFSSKYGHARSYAEMIATKLRGAYGGADKITKEKIKEYHPIIFIGGLYGGEINGISFIKNNFEVLKDRNPIVVVVGLIKDTSAEDFQALLDKNLPREMQEQITFFRARGAVEMKGMGVADRLKFRSFQKSLDKRPRSELTENEREVRRALIEGDTNYMDYGEIGPVVSYAKKIEKEFKKQQEK